MADQRSVSLSVHSLTQCVDRLHHVVSYLQDSIRTCEQLLKESTHPRIRIQQEYEWVPETQLDLYLQKWKNMILPFITSLEQDLEHDIQSYECNKEYLMHQIAEREAHIADEERQRKEQIATRRQECMEKKKFLEAEYKRFLSSVSVSQKT